MYFAASDGDGRWHLFFEDVGAVARPRSPATMISAAGALGRMNGAHAADAELGPRAPWIADSGRSLRFARPRGADARLRGVVADDVRLMVRRIVAELAHHEGVLSTARAGLPTTFSHGDAVPNNVSVERDAVVLFDWNSCGRAAVGTDLGYLLVLPGPPLGASVVERCRQAYHDGLVAVATAAPSRADIELGYRHRFVTLSLRRQLALLPPARPTGRIAMLGDLATLTWTGRRRSRVEANLIRICDEAQALLALVR